MINKLPLGILLLIHAYCVQTQDKITDKMNIAADDPSFSKRDNQYNALVDNNTFTAGNTMCLNDGKCGYHQSTSYSWCYTMNGWEYCCTGECKDTGNQMKCPSGNKKVLCGSPGPKTISGKTCLPIHLCGTHGALGAYSDTYWCYVDYKLNADYCCSPFDKCRDRKDGYGNWCYTGVIYGRRWQYCTP